MRAVCRDKRVYIRRGGGADCFGKGGGEMLNKTALLLVIIGAINWALVGIFQFDLVAWIFGGQAAVVSRILYTIIGIAGLWCISLLFRDMRAT